MKAMNALSTDMYAQLEEAFDELAKDLTTFTPVVLTGSSTVNKKGQDRQLLRCRRRHLRDGYQDL